MLSQKTCVFHQKLLFFPTRYKDTTAGVPSTIGCTAIVPSVVETRATAGTGYWQSSLDDAHEASLRREFSVSLCECAELIHEDTLYSSLPLQLSASCNSVPDVAGVDSVKQFLFTTTGAGGFAVWFVVMTCVNIGNKSYALHSMHVSPVS